MREVTSYKHDTTREILEACIEDILGGYWMCNTLKISKMYKPGKPRGCAIGLVGINGGMAKICKELDQKNTWSVVLNYPVDGGWSAEAKQALHFLALAIPNQGAVPMNVKEVCDLIVDYNDRGNRGEGIMQNLVLCGITAGWMSALRPEQAFAWFKTALALAIADETPIPQPLEMVTVEVTAVQDRLPITT